ncbi:MAG: ornithine cyclodeaminase family protein [Candidatus Eremiobacterota bacterium]
MEYPEKNILFLSLEDVIACGGNDVNKASEDVKRGFELLLEDRIVQPLKTSLKIKKKDHEHRAGLVNFLPACVDLGEEEIYSCKILGAMPPNVEIGLPRAAGLTILFDSVTKTPLCVMDAQVISATRTGGVTRIVAEKIADPETEEIGLVGAGVNMRTQLLGLQLALPRLKKVKVYSRREAKHRFAEEMGERTGLNIVPVDTAEEAVQDCSLIVTCLPNMDKPVVKAEWVKEKGITAINIGCYESETILLKRMDRVFTDIWEQNKHRGVQTLALAVFQGVIPESIVEDIAPVLAGKKPGRQSRDENIFFSPIGLAFEDGLVAWRVYNEAIRKGIGTKLSLWKSCKWI